MTKKILKKKKRRDGLAVKFHEIITFYDTDGKMNTCNDEGAGPNSQSSPKNESGDSGRNARPFTNRPSFKVRSQLQKVISENDFRKLDDAAALARAEILLREVLSDLPDELLRKTYDDCRRERSQTILKVPSCMRTSPKGLKDLKGKLGVFSRGHHLVYEPQSWPVVKCDDGCIYDFRLARDSKFSRLYEAELTGSNLDGMVAILPAAEFPVSRFQQGDKLRGSEWVSIPRCAHCNGTSYQLCDRPSCRLPVCDHCASI